MTGGLAPGARSPGRRGRTEIVGVHDYGSRGLEIVHGLFDHSRVQFFLDLRLHFDEGFFLPRFDLNDVISELALHRFAEFADRNCECHGFEGRDHAAMSESSQVASVGAGTRVVGFSFGQCGEVRTIHQLFPDILRLRQRFFFGQFLPSFFSGTGDPLNRIRMWRALTCK